MPSPENHDFLLGQLVEGQKAMNDKLDMALATLNETKQDHEKRLLKLEMVVAKAVGGAAVISTLVSIVAGVIHAS